MKWVPMSTMNFSIPDDVKEAFNSAFEGENKSAVVAELMRRAVEERVRKKQAGSFMERIRAIRAKATRSYSDEEIRQAREDGRP